MRDKYSGQPKVTKSSALPLTIKNKSVIGDPCSPGEIIQKLRAKKTGSFYQKKYSSQAAAQACYATSFQIRRQIESIKDFQRHSPPMILRTNHSSSKKLKTNSSSAIPTSSNAESLPEIGFYNSMVVTVTEADLRKNFSKATAGRTVGSIV